MLIEVLLSTTLSIWKVKDNQYISMSNAGEKVISNHTILYVEDQRVTQSIAGILEAQPVSVSLTKIRLLLVRNALATVRASRMVLSIDFVALIAS